MNYVFQDNVAWTRASAILTHRFSDRGDVEILDVGCHTGSFLSGLPSKWRKFGVECAAGPIETATLRGVEIIAGRLDCVPAKWDGRFDVVSMFDVLEHLVEPTDGLSRAARLLKPGGMLVISTGDLDAWTWKVLRGRHWYLQSPQHVSIASRRFFEFAARKSSLMIEQFERIPHQRGTRATRFRQAIELLHWDLRQRGGVFRFPQRFLQALPSFRYLAHRESVPWAMQLRDHAIVVLSDLRSAAAVAN